MIRKKELATAELHRSIAGQTKAVVWVQLNPEIDHEWISSNWRKVQTFYPGGDCGYRVLSFMHGIDGDPMSSVLACLVIL